jgi:DNA-binding MurR/RpiR family transcriptional regulator
MPCSSSAASVGIEPSISARIAAALPTLTPIHRRMVKYVVANPLRAATMRVEERAAAVNALVVTANRFARALGFDGYPALRAALVRGFEATLAPVERLRSTQDRIDRCGKSMLKRSSTRSHITRCAPRRPPRR